MLNRQLKKLSTKWIRRPSNSVILQKKSRSIHSSYMLNVPVIPFKLADIGEGIAEVEVMQWFVKEGDAIKQFQNVCEVQSDKATVEITSRYDGNVNKLYYEVGNMAKVGSTLIDIEVDEAIASAENSMKQSTASPISVKSSPTAKEVASLHTSSLPETAITIPPPSSEIVNLRDASCGDKVITTPSVRRLAKEHNIDLAQLIGTGKDKRVMKSDVLHLIKSLASEKKQKSTTKVDNFATADCGSKLTTLSSTSPPSFPSYLEADQILSIKGIQRMMVKTMNASLQIPHFVYGDEVEMDQLHAIRDQLKPLAEKHGIRISFMPLMLKAASLALREHPILNSVVSEDETEMLLKADHNISIAMDTPRGLLVPNVKQVQRKSIMDIAQDLIRLQHLGKDGKLGEDDLSGGTFSLSNIGSIGGTYMKPVIMKPQVCIGAVGKIQTLPRYDGKGNVIPVRIMNVSWSGDHRVIDGATMARFSNLWKSYLENPISMLSHLK